MLQELSKRATEQIKLIPIKGSLYGSGPFDDLHLRYRDLSSQTAEQFVCWPARSRN